MTSEKKKLFPVTLTMLVERAASAAHCEPCFTSYFSREKGRETVAIVEETFLAMILHVKP